jgi:hypothetical protein
MNGSLQMRGPLVGNSNVLFLTSEHVNIRLVIDDES